MIAKVDTSVLSKAKGWKSDDWSISASVIGVPSVRYGKTLTRGRLDDHGLESCIVK